MNIPALRFKQNDGQNFPDWESRQLNRFANKVSTKNRALLVKHVLTNSATQGIVNQSDYFEREIANKNNLGGYYVVELDDFVYNPRISVTAPVGPINRNKAEKGVMSPLYTVFRFREGHLDYLEYYFETTCWHDYLKSVANSGARHDRMSISNSGFLSLPILLPVKQEQTKIANFLTTVDEQITRYTRKCELLAQYKKGVMQLIFSQALRFKDDEGRSFPEWGEQSLNDLLESIIDNRGKTPPIADVGSPLLEVNSLGSREVNYNVVTKFVSSGTYESWFRKHIKNGDILFSTVGATAQCAYFTGEATKAVIAQNIVGLRFKTGHSSSFMYYLLTEQKNKQKFKSIEMVAVQPSVKVSQMIHLCFSVPSIKEQTKIADFLTAIDDKLSNTQAQLAATKQFKQGLLQKMFV